MKRVFLAAVACAFIVSGCDAFKGRTHMPSNEAPVVRVTNGQISVSPDPIEFRRRGAVVVVWSLDDSAAGFTFVDGSGISIANPRDQFDEQRVIANGKKFQVRNKNSVPGRYKYTINLKGPNGNVAFDPLIVNAE